MTAVRTAALAPRGRARAALLEGLPVEERRVEAAGIATELLVGGEGPPLVLLHGPGEFAPKWLRVLPDLTSTHRVIAPDLPAHGESAVPEGPIDADRIVGWLDDLIDRTCDAPPVVVGHVIGGSIAARLASRRPESVARLVLVDSLGLAPFRPRPMFALTMLHFFARPSEGSYRRFMRQCSADLDALVDELGELWEPFVDYTLTTARSPVGTAQRAMMRTVGTPPIPPAELDRIAAPTALIWGRLDRANAIRVARRVADGRGWPLHEIPGCADDPPRDHPRLFIDALREIMAGTG